MRSDPTLALSENVHRNQHYLELGANHPRENHLSPRVEMVSTGTMTFLENGGS